MQALKETHLTLINAPGFWLKTPPLSIEFLARWLDTQGYRVEIFDLNTSFFKESHTKKQQWLNTVHTEEYLTTHFTEQTDDFIRTIQKSRSGLIGFSCFSTNIRSSIYLARLLQEHCPHSRLVFGGPQIFFDYHADGLKSLQAQFPNATFVVGEGFLPLRKLLQAQTTTSTGADQKTILFKELTSLEDFPLCTFEGLTDDTFGFLPLITHFGCIKRCRFCTECLLYKKTKAFPVSYIFDWISYIKKNFPSKFVSFQDSMINMDPLYLENLLDELLKHDITIPWEAQMGVTPTVSSAILLKMKRSGCMNLFIGTESFSDRMLQTMNKGYSSSDCAGLFKRLKKAGFFFEISLITGAPGETEEDFRQTLDFIRQHKDMIPKIAQINPFTPYPGSSWATTTEKNRPDRETAQQRLTRLVTMLKEENIPFTPQYINNLSHG